MKRLKIPFLSNMLGVSYTISAVIVTATTIILIIVASTYAYRILQQQRVSTEFKAAKKSILAFDDALESVAWKRDSALSARFTTEYGHIELIPDAETLVVNVTMGDFNCTTPFSTGLVRYCMKTNYVTFGEGYSSYILGDEKTVFNTTESNGKAIIEQESGWANITLDYRVRAMRASVVNVSGEMVNYVNIWIIKLSIDQHSSYTGDIDLKAKCLNLTSYPLRAPLNVTGEGKSAKIEVQLGNQSSSVSIPLQSGKVVFSFIVATVKVSV